MNDVVEVQTAYQYNTANTPRMTYRTFKLYTTLAETIIATSTAWQPVMRARTDD